MSDTPAPTSAERARELLGHRDGTKTDRAQVLATLAVAEALDRLVEVLGTGEIDDASPIQIPELPAPPGKVASTWFGDGEVRYINDPSEPR